MPERQQKEIVNCLVSNLTLPTQKILLNTASFLKHAKFRNNMAQNYQIIVLLYKLPFENRVGIAEILKTA